MAKIKLKDKTTWDGIDWAKYIDDIIDKHPAQSNKFTRMALCKNYDKGETYYTIDETTNEVVEISGTGELRSAYNIGRPFKTLWKAQLLGNNPVPKVTPHEGNTERFDTVVAKISNSLLASWWVRQKINHKFGDAADDGAVCGLMALKTFYDAEGGAKRYVDKDALKELGYDKEEERDEVTLGEIGVECVGVHKEYFPDPVATKDEDRRLVIHRFKQARSIVEDRFNRKRGDFKKDDPMLEEKDLVSSTLSADTYHTDQSTKESDTVYVSELWMKSDKKYENGKHVICVNDETVLSEDNPEPDRLPIYAAPINATSGEYYGIGYYYPSISLIRDYNKASSGIMHNADWCGNIKILKPVEGNIKDGSFDDTAGEIIEYAGGAKPEYLHAAPLPEYLVRNPDRIMMVMQIIWGLPDVDMGMIPERGSQISGKGIQELRKSAAAVHMGDVGFLSDMIQRLSMDYLNMCQKYYDVDDLMAIVGENKRSEIEKFLEADINPDSLDIKIDIGKYGESADIKLDFILKMTQARPDLLTSAQIYDLMSTEFNIDMMIEDTLLDKRQAKRYLDRILDGEDGNGLASAYANHAVHIQVFKDFTKTPEYDDIDGNIKANIDKYIRTETMRMQEQMMQQNQSMMPPGARPGAPPGGGNQVGGQTALDKIKAEGNTHLAQGQPTGAPPMQT